MADSKLSGKVCERNSGHRPWYKGQSRDFYVLNFLTQARPYDKFQFDQFIRLIFSRSTFCFMLCQYRFYVLVRQLFYFQATLCI